MRGAWHALQHLLSRQQQRLARCYPRGLVQEQQAGHLVQAAHTTHNTRQVWCLQKVCEQIVEQTNCISRLCHRVHEL